MSSVRVEHECCLQAVLVTPRLDHFGHRQRWPYLVVSTSNQEDLADALDRDCGIGDTFRESTTALLVEAHEGGWIRVGLPVVDEAHIRKCPAGQGPVRRQALVESDSRPNHIGGSEGNDRADVRTVSARQKRRLRSERGTEHDDPIGGLREVSNAFEEGFQRNVPWPFVLALTPEPSD